MKRVSLFAFSFLCMLSAWLFPQAAPQWQWQWMHPSPQGNLLRWVKVIDANTYFAGGNSGTFIKTTDGGATWTTRFDVTRTASNGVHGTAQAAHFFDANSGLICGTYGVTITNDGGQTFDTTTTVLPSGVTWYGMRFLSRSTGYIAGTTSGRMAKTTDGGHTWTLNTTLPSATYYDVWPMSENRIVIVGSYTSNANVRYTTDAGATWNTSSAGTGTLNCVTFADSLNGWAAGGNGVSFRTVNGGLSWTAMTTGAPTTVIFYSIVYNNGSLYIVGDPANLYKSTDMGQTFTTVNCTDPAQTIKGAFLGLGISGQTMIVAGNAGQVNKSTDGGATWTGFLKAAKNGQNYALWAGGSGKMIAVGSQTTGATIPDQIIVSSNAGTSWRSLTTMNSLSSFRGIQMLTRDTGFICGTLGNIYKTTNGGLSWDSLATNIPTSLTINYVQFVNQNYGWAFSQSGHIWKTTNGGTQWSFIRPDTLTNFLCGHMFDTLSGMAVGTGGGMYKTTDGGTLWVPMNSGLTNTFFWLKMLDRTRGFIAASGGMLLKTTDGGNTWPSVNIGTPAALYSIDALDMNNLVIGGGTGFFFRTTDGGAAWQRTVNGGGSLVAVKFVHPDTVFVAGSSGSIIRYISRGGTPAQCTDIRVAAGWNMLSVPRSAPDMSAGALFPLKTSPAFTFSNGYITQDTMKRGIGYWMRFPASHIVRVCGDPFPATSIRVNAGWNMIGPHHATLPVSGISSTPPGIVNSLFYGYNNGYNGTDSLQPGRGYWVRVTSDGVLNMQSAAAGKSGPSAIETAGAGKLVITDQAGNIRTLYFTDGSVNEASAALPPVPPAGIFDVRFSNQSAITQFGGQANSVELHSPSFPLTLKAENADLHIRDNINGEILNATIHSGEVLQITNSAIGSLIVSAAQSVTAFNLLQNYPNPFNPSTKISFTIPGGGFVTLKIYNILGQQTATLLEKELKAGYHETEFDAGTLATGIYIYELRMNDFRAVRKMILVR